MTRRPPPLRLAWLACLALPLTLAVLAFGNDAEPMGEGASTLALWGFLLGLALAPVGFSVDRAVEPGRTRLARVGVAGACVLLGLMAGVSFTTFLNRVGPVGAREAITLPMIAVERKQGRRSWSLEVATIATEPPYGPETRRLDKEFASEARPGRCLHLVKRVGWLGGAWTEAPAVRDCDPRRGPPGSRVSAGGPAGADWRWRP